MGQIGHQGDDGNAGRDQPTDRDRDLRLVGGLEDHALRTTLRDLVQGADQVPGGRAGLTEMEARPYESGMQRGQFGFECVPYRGGEPLRSLHHDVDHEGAATEPDLALLAVQVLDGFVHLPDGALRHVAPLVEDAVDRGRAQSGLPGRFP